MKDQQVLVVDDDSDIRQVIAESLLVLGCNVQEASSGNDAAALIAKNRFDIVVTDLRMPKGGGISLLKTIRESSHSSPLVFLITGFSDYSVETIFALGADGMILKPFGHTTLRGALAKSLLSPSQRLGSSTRPATHRSLKIELNPNDLASSFKLGRNGFSFSILEKISVDEIVAFNTTLIADAAGEFPWGNTLPSGFGQVRWSKPGADGKVLCGIEFLTLSVECREPLLRFIEISDFLARIPSW